MIKFFNRIRHSLLSEGKFSKYLLYAIGEIALVMIGILLALQVNNWNANRIQNNEIEAKYQRLKEELNSTSIQVEKKAKLLDSSITTKNNRSLHLLKLKDKDSIRKLYETLRGLTTVVTVSYDMPDTSEFIDAGYVSKIENSKLKTLLLQLKRAISFGEEVDDYSMAQLNTLIEPYAMKNINYAQMIGSKRMTSVNVTKDYTRFFNDLELENLINLKIETDRTKINYLNRLSKLLKITSQEITSELGNKKWAQ